MIIYRDAISGDELFSDSYKIKVVEDLFFEIEGKMVSEKTEVTDAMIGGNASAEGGVDEGAEDVEARGCDIAIANRLKDANMDKAAFKDYIKGYMKRLTAHIKKVNPDREAAFKSSAQAAVKKILEEFKDWDVYIGEKGIDGEGMPIFMNFRADGLTPFMRFFRDGVVEEKV